MKKTPAPQFLHKAARLMEARGKQYDQPGGERSMGRAVAAFNAIAGQEMTEAQGWLLLTLLKLVRDNSKLVPHLDSLEDGVAYFALYAEARTAYEALHPQNAFEDAIVAQLRSAPQK